MFRAKTPPVGTALRYSINGGGGQSASVVIQNAAGEVVRTLEGPGGAGVHSVWWDLRSNATADATQARGTGTPSEWAYQQLVPAGTYRVVVQVGGDTVSTMVKVREEPASAGQAASRR